MHAVHWLHAVRGDNACVLGEKSKGLVIKMASALVMEKWPSGLLIPDGGSTSSMVPVSHEHVYQRRVFSLSAFAQ